MAAFKAFASWFAAERLPAINGSALAAGGVGAIAATAPLEAVLQLTDWRGVFVGLSIASLLAAAAFFFVVPDHPSRVLHGNLRVQLKQVAQVFSSGRFWRVASLAMLTQATFMSVQTLWAGPWLRDVAGLSRTEAANHLLVLAIGMIAGYLILGNLASRLAQHGLQPFTLAKSGMFIFMLVQLAIAIGVTWASLPIFFLFGFFGTSGTLCYAILSQLFPATLAGRVNTAFNLLVFVSSFLSQWAIGAVVNWWPAASGGYSIQGYRTAFGLFLALQRPS